MGDICMGAFYYELTLHNSYRSYFTEKLALAASEIEPYFKHLGKELQLYMDIGCPRTTDNKNGSDFADQFKKITALLDETI